MEGSKGLCSPDGGLYHFSLSQYSHSSSWLHSSIRFLFSQILNVQSRSSPLAAGICIISSIYCIIHLRSCQVSLAVGSFGFGLARRGGGGGIWSGLSPYAIKSASLCFSFSRSSPRFKGTLK